MRTADELLDATQSLLDHQVVDEEGGLICKVDDIELEERGGELRLTFILDGPGALGPRLDHPIGDWMTYIWERLTQRDGPGRIPLSAVARLSSAVHLTHVSDSYGVQGFENWARKHVISRLPGALDD